MIKTTKQPVGCDAQLSFGELSRGGCPRECLEVCLGEVFREIFKRECQGNSIVRVA